MSPEQARGVPVDARADVWSLGCVLYEMVTACRPFEGESLFDIVAAVLDREPPPISGIRPDCPPALVSLIERMLLKDREARVQSMAQVVHELKQVARGLETGVAVPAAEPMSRRPHERSALLVGAAAIVLGAGAWFWSRAPQALLPDSRPAKSATDAAGGATAPDARGTTRALTYWLTVQKVRDGKHYQSEFQSSGREIFENGWRFRLHASSPDEGYFYMLNEGPGEGGRTTFHMLFPDPGVNEGSAALTPSIPVQSPWYRLTDHPGTERLWLVAAAEPVRALEQVTAVVNPVDRGLVSDPEQVAAVARLLAGSRVAESQVTKEPDGPRTTVEGPARLLVHRLDLVHH
jgi:hypothetical protein